MNTVSIKLNVGGKIFETTTETLLTCNYFEALLKRFPLKDKSEPIFIDRPPHIFKHVLSLMRDPQYYYPAEYHSELLFFQYKYCKNMNMKFKTNQKLDSLQDFVNEIDRKTKSGCGGGCRKSYLIDRNQPWG